MSRRLAESAAIGACRRLGQIRRTPPSLGCGPRSHLSSTSTPLRITSSRIRPAAAAPPFADLRRHFRGTAVARDDAAPAPASARHADDVAPFTSPKVEALFEKIIWLDMVEVHLLAELINEKMGITITDAERERMASGGGGNKGGDVEEAEVVEEKTAFDLKLTGFDAKSKIKVIKEVRAMTSLGLKEAKALVDGAPSTVKKNIKKEEAEELKVKLEALGATVEIV